MAPPLLAARDNFLFTWSTVENAEEGLPRFRIAMLSGWYIVAGCCDCCGVSMSPKGVYESESRLLIIPLDSRSASSLRMPLLLMPIMSLQLSGADDWIGGLLNIAESESRAFGLDTGGSEEVRRCCCPLQLSLANGDVITANDTVELPVDRPRSGG